MINVSPWIYATDACNLRCPYCFEEHKTNVMSEETWSALSEHFIKLIRDWTIDTVRFRISGGEPLICFDSWREFPIYLSKVLGGRFGAGLLTNFTLLNDEISDYLIKNAIGCGVSLDGTIHSKIDVNQQSTAKKVMENIAWYSDRGGTCNILTVLNDTNVGTGEILELAEFVVKYQLPWSVNSDIFVMQGNDCIDQMYNDVIEAVEYLRKSHYNMSSFNFQFLTPHRPCSSGCMAGDTGFSIHADGGIYPCQTCKGQALGNIKDCDNVVELVRNQTLYSLGKNYKRPDVCSPSHCVASYHCKGSCKLHMNPSDDNPKCQLIRRIHKYFVNNRYYQH